MKKLSKILTFSALCLLGMPMVSSCSFFKTKSSDAVGIKTITVDRDEDGKIDVDDDGNIILTIVLSNKEEKQFILYKGQDGTEGVGIDNIDYESDEFGVTTVTITLTNGKEISFDLAPGKSINNVVMELDDDGNTVIYFIDSDGNKLDPITVYKGDTGEAGVGIALLEPDYHNDGSITINILLTNGAEYQIEIPAPKEGRGIDSIVSTGLPNEDGYYVMTVNYSDGTSQDLFLKAPPMWTSGSKRPGDDFGSNGDYFFDTVHDVIYIKQNGEWVVAVNFATDSSTYKITFMLNDDATHPADVDFLNDSNVYPGIPRGETFYSFGCAVPCPTRPTYKFVGWCTTKSPNPTNGYFTDLTPVLSDMTLYAIWSN